MIKLIIGLISYIYICSNDLIIIFYLFLTECGSYIFFIITNLVI